MPGIAGSAFVRSIAVALSMIPQKSRRFACLVLLLVHAHVFVLLPAILVGGSALSEHRDSIHSTDSDTKTCNCPCKRRGDGICHCECCNRGVICTCSLSSDDEFADYSTPVKDAVLSTLRAINPPRLFGRTYPSNLFHLKLPVLKVPTPPPQRISA